VKRDAYDPPSIPLTPLIDISFLVLVFFMFLPLRSLDGKLEAHLPKGVGLERARVEPAPAVRIRVAWRDGRALYRLGAHAAEEARGLAPVVLALGAGSAYEIEADAAVPWDRVVEVVDVLKGFQVRDLRFVGGRRPAAR
jgi:biopolymer transport protein ExbD